MKKKFIGYIILSFETAKEARLSSNVKHPKNIPYTMFILPDGQRLGYGCNPLSESCKNRIGGWEYCRTNIIAKLKDAIKRDDILRQRFLVKLLNVVQDDNHYCNFINGFNTDIKSKKITFEQFETTYKARLSDETI